MQTSLSIKLGSWFEAQASGWGVVAFPFVVFLLAILAVAHVLAV